MDTVFVLLFLGSAICLIISLIYPAAFIKLLKERATRGTLALMFGAFAFIAMLGIVATTDTPQAAIPVDEVQRTEPVETTETVEETKTIEFKSIEREDPTFPEGEKRFERDGKNGLKLVTYKVTLVDGKETSRTVVDRETLKKAVNEVVLVGTLVEISTTEAISFETQEVNDPNMDQGTTKIMQDGVNGEKARVYKVGYRDGEEVSRELVRETVIKEPTPKIVAIGIRQPETVYITNTGSKYHQDHGHVGGCHSYLSQSKIPISKSDARAQGYAPCGCVSCNW